ncbi:MAG: DUF3347 domain-containing protein [Flavobacteriales bacterium]|nr:DUF3347 domain-containing protein [Flavobacteriales bacterium]
MKTLLSLIALPSLLFFSSCSAQIKNAHSTTVRIDGDCPMCEKTIEKAAFVKGEAEADWDVDAKTARITFDSTRTSMDAVLQRIAYAGYDSERYLAPDAAYAALPGCCQYVRTFKKAPLTTTPVEHAGHEGMGTDHAQHGSTAPDTLAAQVPANPKSDQFNGLFTAYFALKDALVASDAKKAAAHASELSAAVKAVQMERMGPELHGAWMQVMEPLANISAGIASKTDIEAQRKAFAELSAPILALVKVAPRPEPVYYDHCPMYEGGADWLSQEKGIKNPFYGSMMLTCGSVKETITK